MHTAQPWGCNAGRVLGASWRICTPPLTGQARPDCNMARSSGMHIQFATSEAQLSNSGALAVRAGGGLRRGMSGHTGAAPIAFAGRALMIARKINAWQSIRRALRSLTKRGLPCRSAVCPRCRALLHGGARRRGTSGMVMSTSIASRSRRTPAKNTKLRCFMTGGRCDV